MRDYPKPCCGLLSFNIRGSPFPRILLYSLSASAITALLEVYNVDLVTNSRTLDGSGGFIHPYPFQIWAFLVGFGLIFRTNLAYNRYWSARLALATISSKWCDAATQFRSFLRTPTSNEELERLTALNNQFVHNISLLHCVSIFSLRGDDALQSPCENIIVDYPSSEEATKVMQHPPEPSLDSSDVLPQTSRIVGIFFPRFYPSYNTLLASLNPLPVLFPLTPSDYKIFNLQPSTPGLAASQQTLKVHSMAVKSLKNGDLDIPPPVFTRLLQVLSEGTLGFQTGLAIKDTPFPFPYAQAIALMVWTFVLVVPIIMSAFLEGVALATIATFITTTSYLALNQVSRELEDPFGGDSNHLPLAWTQWTFNRRVSAACKKLDVGREFV